MWCIIHRRKGKASNINYWSFRYGKYFDWYRLMKRATIATSHFGFDWMIHEDGHTTRNLSKIKTVVAGFFLFWEGLWISTCLSGEPGNGEVNCTKEPTPGLSRASRGIIGMACVIFNLAAAQSRTFPWRVFRFCTAQNFIRDCSVCLNTDMIDVEMESNVVFICNCFIFCIGREEELRYYGFPTNLKILSWAIGYSHVFCWQWVPQQGSPARC